MHFPDWLGDDADPRLSHWLASRAQELARDWGGEELDALAARLQAVLDHHGRIPAVNQRAGMLYNLWTDEEHPRGLWRRTTWESFILGAPLRADRHPDETQWEVLLDLDEASERLGQHLVWRGAQVLTRGPLAGRRALVTVSPGGGDAAWTREYDLDRCRALPAAEGGFSRETSKGSLTWADTVGEAVFLREATEAATRAGYPRLVRRRRRGAERADDEIVLACPREYVSAFAAVDEWGRTWLTAMPSFGSTRIWWLPDDAECPRGDEAAREALVRDEVVVPAPARELPVPPSCSAGVGREWVTMQLREEWTLEGVTYAPGTLVAAPLRPWLEGGDVFAHGVRVLFSPTPHASLSGAMWTRGHLVLTVLDDAVERLEVCTPPSSPDGQWRHTDVDLAGTAGGGPGERALLAVSAYAIAPATTDYVWITATGWTTPSTLGVGRLNERGELEGLTVVRQAPARYDAKGVKVSQHMATSSDGTRVPYFLIGQRRAPGETQAALVQVYGAFGRSLTPGYDPVVGAGWLERGGCLVVANVRGGGEYGPAWHEAGRGPGRERSVEDLHAVVRDLHVRGVSTPWQTVVTSSSAGAIVAATAVLREPDLWAGMVLDAPLLDLERYPRLAAGAAWLSEFGDPQDPQQWEWMRRLSAVHQVEGGRTYPPVLLVDSGSDDRVHPWHARAMAYALAREARPVWLAELEEGGHGAGRTAAEQALAQALTLSFAWRCAGGEES